VSTDRELRLGTLPEDVDGSGDHGATWRPGTIAAGATASVEVPVSATASGAGTIRLTVVGADALDPRRPFGRGPFVDAQRASATSVFTVASAAPSPTATPTAQPAAQPSPTPAPTSVPLAAVDPRALVALARPAACHRRGTRLRVVFTAPAGTAIRSATAARKGRRATALTGTLRGTVRLPLAISRAVEGRPGTKRTLVIAVVLTDGRTVTRELTIRTCR
jgi:hypothetical protein